MNMNYSEVVQQCFRRGEPDWKDWDDYLALGFTPAHVPELIHILENTAQIWDQVGEEDPSEWAPIHAWRGLAQLGAVEALPAMLRLHETEGENDWVGEEIPEALAKLGPSVLGDLREYHCNPKNEPWTRIAVAHALELMSNQHPESRPDCVAILCAGLDLFEQNDETVNGFIISYLADINAPETAALVERAFQSSRVDLSIMGDYEEFQIAVGLLKERLTSPPKYGWFMPGVHKAFLELEEQRKSKERQAEKKEKKKRKQEKKTRKRQKKK
ncbi:MAG TPA: DUF1186 domain-containing protein [Anaerolineales bacterium]